MGSSLREALLPSRAFRRQPPGVMGIWQLRSHSSGVNWVLQDLPDAVVSGRPPGDPAQGQVALHDRELHRRRAGPQEDLARTAEFAELAEDEPDRLGDVLIGVDLDLTRFAPAVAGRQGEAQFTATGLGVAGGEAALAHKAEFVLGHRAFEPQ